VVGSTNKASIFQILIHPGHKILISVPELGFVQHGLDFAPHHESNPRFLGEFASDAHHELYNEGLVHPLQHIKKWH
jgi:hypothetical protein